MQHNVLILLAAGSSTRMRGSVEDKNLAELCGKPVVIRCLETFIASEIFERVLLVYREDQQREQIERLVQQANISNITIDWVCGGAERQDSVFNALKQVPSEADYIFIHDCARPLVSTQSIRALYAVVQEDGAAVLAHRVTDTIKESAPTRSDEEHPSILCEVQRDHLWAVETPQAFAAEPIMSAYQKLFFEGKSVTDDTAVFTNSGYPVTLVENQSPNPKLTSPMDFVYAEFLLKYKTAKKRLPWSPLKTTKIKS